MRLPRNIPHLGLLFLLAVTSLAPLLFVQLNDAETRHNVWKLLAKTGSLVVTVLMVWQLLLGYRQLAARWVGGDFLWTVAAHRWVGGVVGALVLLHPTLITLLYLQARGINPFSLRSPWPLGPLVWVGVFTLLLLVGIVLSSLFWRDRMGRSGWYVSHLCSYLLLPLVFIHGMAIGDTLGETALRHVWQGLMVLVALIYLLRLAGSVGWLSAEYEVVATEHAADDVVEITLKPLARPLRPRAAQFAFFRRGRWGRTRPFTISSYEPSGGVIGITVKALGSESGRLQEVQTGERFWVDGPYGTFGREAFETDRCIVMLAGGIGITPFRRLIRELDKVDRESFLFYANRYEKDIAHREEIEGAEDVELIHVLTGHEEHEEFAVGRITPEFLDEHLEQALDQYEYFVCGPTEMIKSLEEGLMQHSVSRAQLHHESFDY